MPAFTVPKTSACLSCWPHSGTTVRGTGSPASILQNLHTRWRGSTCSYVQCHLIQRQCNKNVLKKTVNCKIKATIHDFRRSRKKCSVTEKFGLHGRGAFYFNRNIKASFGSVGKEFIPEHFFCSWNMDQLLLLRKMYWKVVFRSEHYFIILTQATSPKFSVISSDWNFKIMISNGYRHTCD